MTRKTLKFNKPLILVFAAPKDMAVERFWSGWRF